jgi:hypothetical protein
MNDSAPRNRWKEFGVWCVSLICLVLFMYGVSAAIKQWQHNRKISSSGWLIESYHKDTFRIRHDHYVFDTTCHLRGVEQDGGCGMAANNVGHTIPNLGDYMEQFGNHLENWKLLELTMWRPGSTWLTLELRNHDGITAAEDFTVIGVEKER